MSETVHPLTLHYTQETIFVTFAPSTPEAVATAVRLIVENTPLSSVHLVCEDAAQVTAFVAEAARCVSKFRSLSVNGKKVI